MRTYGTTFLLRSPRGVISTHRVDPELGNEDRAIAKALDEAKTAKKRWEASDQFIGVKLTIEETSG